MLSLYRIFSCLVTPLARLYLRIRRFRGKEHPARFRERLGYASASCGGNQKPLLWIHAASVGEAQSVLGLIGELRAQYPQQALLVTTGTVSSAELLAARLPEGVVHQFVPVDLPQAVRRFIAYWRPDAALWVESELWPNLILSARASGCRMAIVNGRMSARSFDRWRRFPGSIRRLLSCFDLCLAQSAEDAARFQALGATHVECAGNLKYDAEPLQADAMQLETLHAQIGARPLWLAASTHPGEEAVIAQAHRMMAAAHPGLLTLIVPRHAPRGGAIATMLAKDGWRTAQRSQGDAVTPDTSFYIADTMGELGLFYRLAEIVLMGGALVPHGGQNPLEAARLSCALLLGPHMENFAAVTRELESAHACLRVESAAQIAEAAGSLLRNPQQRAALAANAFGVTHSHRGVTARVAAALRPLLE